MEATAGAPLSDEAAALARIEHSLDAVEAVLEQLDGGTHGRCEVCGVALEPRVLDVDPLASRCRTHALPPS